MYTVTFADARVSKSLECLPSDIEQRIIHSLIELETNPRSQGAIMLSGQLKGSWRVRIGNYRVIDDIDDANKKVYITKIAHRSQIYRL